MREKIEALKAYEYMYCDYVVPVGKVRKLESDYAELEKKLEIAVEGLNKVNEGMYRQVYQAQGIAYNALSKLKGDQDGSK